MFKYEIFLKECKRLKSEEDKLKLKNIKNDFFVNKLPYKSRIEKYFKYVDKIEVCYNNIAYENKTCKSVSHKIRELLNTEKEYETDDIVICKEYFKVNGFTFNVNIRYRIINIGSGIATFRECKDIRRTKHTSRNITRQIYLQLLLYSSLVPRM